MTSKGEPLEIKILGSGCVRCKKVEELTKNALSELKINARVTRVTDPVEISHYILNTPGLVINENVKCSGKVPSKDVIIKYIQEEIPACR